MNDLTRVPSEEEGGRATDVAHGEGGRPKPRVRAKRSETERNQGCVASQHTSVQELCTRKRSETRKEIVRQKRDREVAYAEGTIIC